MRQQHGPSCRSCSRGREQGASRLLALRLPGRRWARNAVPALPGPAPHLRSSALGDLAASARGGVSGVRNRGGRCKLGGGGFGAVGGAAAGRGRPPRPAPAAGPTCCRSRAAGSHGGLRDTLRVSMGATDSPFGPGRCWRALVVYCTSWGAWCVSCAKDGLKKRTKLRLSRPGRNSWP